MKHIFLIILIIFSFNAKAKEDGLSLIKRRGYIKCGTDFGIKAFVQKDKEGFNKGLAVDICKVLAVAILGKEDAVEVLDIRNNNVSNALLINKVDVVVSGVYNTATQEISSKISPAALLYYDRLKFLGYKKEGAISLSDYKNSKVCVVNNFIEDAGVEHYSAKYNLDLNILRFATRMQAKEAFLLKRCDLIADSEIYLSQLVNDNMIIISDSITEMPINVFVLRDNSVLRIAIKWIVNALILAEQNNLNKQTEPIFIAQNDKVNKNLFGQDPNLWQKLGLKPNWVKKAVELIGNFGEIYNNNIESLGILRKENNLKDNDGLIMSEMFL